MKTLGEVFRVGAAALSALAGITAGPEGLAAEPAEPASIVGSAAPRAGGVVLSGEGGMIFVVPTLSVAVNVGLGGGVSAELRYRNIAGLGHAGKLRLAWSRRIHRGLVYGVAVRTSITSLLMTDESLLGVQFSNVAIGNDWLVGADLALTWSPPPSSLPPSSPPRSAHVTATLGPTFTLGGLRYQSFEERALRIEPALRAFTGSVQGEWQLRPRFNVYLRLDADVLLRAKIMPLGFIPTGTAGVGWAV